VSAIALVLVDVIHDFFHPAGRNHHPSYLALLPVINDLIDVAHAHDRPVVHAIEWHRPGPDFEQPKLPVHCLADSWDVQFPSELTIAPQDLIVHKRRYSAFFGTDLDLLLRERGVTSILVAGVKSHVCIRATIQDAFAHGYRALLVRDATGSNRGHLHEASLEDIERYLGWVVSLREAKAALAEEGR
jgi:maleamate amidohydrolase